MNRRTLFQLMASSGYVYLGFQLAACGSSPSTSAVRDDATPAAGATVKLFDIRMEGWSTLGSGFLGENGVLKASVIRDNKTVTLTYVQDDHGHTFVLTPELFGKLRRGEKISVITTLEEGHRHEVRIDPKRIVAGSEGLTMPVDPDQTVPPTPVTTPTAAAAAQPEMHAGLSEAESPNLYVSASSELDATSVQYCVETPSNCDADATLWQAMKVDATRQDRQVFVSGDALTLGHAAEQPLNVRGKAKDGSAVKFLMKLVAKTAT